MQRILVTGGAGFIGSNLVRYLLGRPGYRVRVLDKLTYAGNLDNFPASFWKDQRFEFIRADVCNRQAVRKALRGCDALVNLVAETHIDRSIADVDRFVRTDFIGTYLLLDEFRRNPCDRFIHVSTCEVYGSAQRVPMDESHPIAPQSPYAATKAGADRLCHAYHSTYGLPIVILRPFNAYGPNQYPEKLIPFFLTQALQDKPLLVYGSGRNTRDWTYVPDLCRLLETVLCVEESKVTGQVFNVGSGEEKSVLEIAKAVLEYLGKDEAGLAARPESAGRDRSDLPRRTIVKHIKDRPGHVERLVCDTRKVKEVLGWQASTSFEPGLQLTLDWYCENRMWWQKIRRRKSYKMFYRDWYEKALGAGIATKTQRPKGVGRRSRKE